MTIAVLMTADAAADFQSLPATIKGRVRAIVARLAQWPNVSGAKPLGGALAGHYRIRTGDWRIIFTVKADVIIVRIRHRSEVYDS